MTIVFNKGFYKLSAVKKAIKAYKNLAKFGTKEEKNKIKVELSKIDKDVKNIIKDEFSNYVLAEMKNEH